MATKILTPFGAFAGTPAATVVPATGTIVANETGFDSHRITTIDIADLVLGATTNASLGIGKLIYTLPAGDIIITRATTQLSMIGTAALNAASTPVVGLGTVIASGAVAVLSGTATFENIKAGVALADCNSTIQRSSVALTLGIASASAHSVYLNAAVAWAGIDAGMKITGRVIIEWAYMS